MSAHASPASRCLQWSCGRLVIVFELNDPQQPTPLANDARAEGSPLTAYVVAHDADFGEKEASQFSEKVKLSDGSWQTISIEGLPSGRLPDATSRLSGSSFEGQDWNPDGSLWVYYATTTGTTAKIIEVRRTPSSPCKIENILPPQAIALPGSAISNFIDRASIDIYLQDHQKIPGRGKIGKIAGLVNAGVVIGGDKVQVNTPIVTFNYAGKKPVLVVDNNNPRMIQDYVGGAVTAVEKLYPDSWLGVIHHGTPILFYRSLSPVGAIETKVLNGSGWEQGATVFE
ncbi:Peptidase M20 [Penicillium atrosanguineum]|uniref:Peptidase M20 n=1 Tax=Penicillium atrosanguineum TaxID=1132637 RepID=UPI002395EE60|nr:Peptidase M20 [Penicillium atrosanguineum]KAJ5293046.1 Peptidase M20 [Penicillium atrosanguineum]